ncbi:MAG: phosphoribosylanthranilate isomerase [Paracoccaceae bacterium]
MECLVKICGITSKRDLKAAQELGASFVGFVLEEKSKRFISLERLELLSMTIRRPLKSVALLVDPSNNFLEKLLMSSKVDYIQLHGEESPERVKEIAKITNVPLIKAIGVEKETDLVNIRSYENFVDYILLDSKEKEKGHLKGGRGIRFNWNIIRGFNFKKPWFLAGGLNANNVIDAMKTTGAKMLDVSTGVENEPGKKSFDKMRKFIGRANGEFT